MGKAKLKTRRHKRMDKHKQEALIREIKAGVMSRQEILDYFEISVGNYYRYVSMAKKQKADAPVHGPFKPVVVETKQEAFPSGVVIRMSDMDMATGRYLTGMAMAFDKTIAEVIDDLVDVAVEIGTAHIHAKKAK